MDRISFILGVFLSVLVGFFYYAFPLDNPSDKGAAAFLIQMWFFVLAGVGLGFGIAELKRKLKDKAKTLAISGVIINGLIIVILVSI